MSKTQFDPTLLKLFGKLLQVVGGRRVLVWVRVVAVDLTRGAAGGGGGEGAAAADDGGGDDGDPFLAESPRISPGWTKLPGGFSIPLTVKPPGWE